MTVALDWTVDALQDYRPAAALNGANELKGIKRSVAGAHCRGSQIFHRCRSRLKVLGVTWVTDVKQVKQPPHSI